MITIQTDDYAQTQALISALTEHKLQASLTEGGVTLHLQPDQIPLANQIVRSIGLELKSGNAVVPDSAVITTDSATHEIALHSSGQALLQEWLLD